MINNRSSRNIVILSTEPWGKMLLSKMHYAIELVRNGDKVFFVNPPRISNNKKLAVVAEEREDGRLVIIDTYALPGSLFFRHKLFFLYKALNVLYTRAIRKIVASRIHEVWCFNPHVYVDLRRFQAEKTLLLIYDFYKGDHVFKAAETADGIVSVSQLILDYYGKATPRKLLVQHGLGKFFTDRSLQKLKDHEFAAIRGGKRRIGYMGNLLRAGMNTDVARRIIEKHTDKEFHFWGPSSLEGNNVNGSGADIPPDLVGFISFLERQKNVFLHGVTEQEALAAGLSEMDAFLFLYSPKREMNAASNSHKLLEYLSTGKTIVSTYVSNYEGTDLLLMCGKDGEDDLPDIFDKAIEELTLNNAKDQQLKRIHFALDNTYARQTERIRQFINR